MPVEVRRTIPPPDRPSLPQAALRLVDQTVRRGFGVLIAGGLCCLHGPARVHQLLNQARLFVGSKIRIAHPPKFAADDEVASVRRHGMPETWHPLYLARTDLAPVLFSASAIFRGSPP